MLRESTIKKKNLITCEGEHFREYPSSLHFLLDKVKERWRGQAYVLDDLEKEVLANQITLTSNLETQIQRFVSFVEFHFEASDDDDKCRWLMEIGKCADGQFSGYCKFPGGETRDQELVEGTIDRLLATQRVPQCTDPEIVGSKVNPG